MSLNSAVQAEVKKILTDFDEEERQLHQTVTERFRGMRNRVEVFFGLDRPSAPEESLSSPADSQPVDVKVTTES